MARAIRQGVVLVRLSGAATRTIIIMTGAEVEDTMTEEVLLAPKCLVKVTHKR